MDHEIKISVVTTCLNEEEVLPKFVEATVKVLQSIGINWELVIVDDGSKDNTWETIMQHREQDNRIIGIKLTRNFGHQAALCAGLKASKGGIIITIDADLQDNPNLIPEMIKPILDKEVDIVYGVRPHRPETSLIKNICYRGFYKILNLISECPITPDSGDFRAMSRRVVETIIEMPEQTKFIRGLCSWSGFEGKEFIYTRDSRKLGNPSYDYKRLLCLARDGIVGFSTKPLKLATMFASLCGITSIILITWVLIGGIFGPEAPKGWLSLSITILLCSGANLLVLGIIGEYIGQILKQTKRRPEYIIEKEER